MSISFRFSAREIRFSTTKGVLVTSVTEDRIVWDDYREAGTKLVVPPPGQDRIGRYGTNGGKRGCV
jgi:hypothetical protein